MIDDNKFKFIQTLKKEADDGERILVSFNDNVEKRKIKFVYFIKLIHNTNYYI